MLFRKKIVISGLKDFNRGVEVLGKFNFKRRKEFLSFIEKFEKQFGEKYNDSRRVTRIDNEEKIKAILLEQKIFNIEESWEGQISTDCQYEGCIKEEEISGIIKTLSNGPI